MGRWLPDAQGRLRQAATELMGERGYDQITVAEIAARAGLTERTFFRHFTDKREVLFAGAAGFQAVFVDAIAGAADGSSPMDAVAAALDAVGTTLDDRDFSRQRRSVIDAHPDLQERELIKLATLGSAMAAALRTRGVPEPAASLAAQAGVAVFHVGFDRWTDPDGAEPDLAVVLRQSLAELRAVTA